MKMGKFHGKRGHHQGHQDILNSSGNEAMVLSLDRHALQAARKPLVAAGQEISSPLGIQGMLTQPRAHENRINTPGIFCKLQGQLFFTPRLAFLRCPVGSTVGSSTKGVFPSLRLASTTPQGRWQKASRAWRLAVSAARPPPVARQDGALNWSPNGTSFFGHQNVRLIRDGKAS